MKTLISVKIICFFSILLFISGCKTSKPNFNFPDDIKWMCYDAKNQSKELLQTKGLSLKEKKGCKVIKIPGTKKFGPMWAYYSKEWNQYIGGICGGDYIEIACDPNTGEVYFPVLKHEFAHYWLITNHNDWGHDPNYKDLFYNWYSPRSIARSFNEDGSIKLIIPEDIKYGEIFSLLHADENGNLMHIHFIRSND